MKKLLLILYLPVQFCWGWGEVGHHLIARSAVEILKSHPIFQSPLTDQKSNQESFLKVFQSKQYQQGHVANIPDTYWRNLDQGLLEEGNLLGSPSHYLDSEELLTPLKLKTLAEAKIPLTYEGTKKLFPDVPNFFKNVGSLPWRAQQFFNLYSKSLKKMGNEACAKSKTSGDESTRISLTFAGLMAHYTGDVSMPYHTTIDHDAIAVGQKGIHGYFEQDLVTELELSNLFHKVTERAEKLLTSKDNENGPPSIELLKARSLKTYPQNANDIKPVALMMMVAADSFSLIEKLRQLDYTYAIASLAEALNMPECQQLVVVKELKNQFEKLDSDQRNVFGKVKVLSLPSGYHDKKTESACRRKPSTRVNAEGELSNTGKTVAQWHEDFIVERLALSAALTAEIWVSGWVEAGAPELCGSYLYAHKPSFVSPTDPRCFGYALGESPRDFLKKNGRSALTTFEARRHSPNCVSF